MNTTSPQVPTPTAIPNTLNVDGTLTNLISKREQWEQNQKKASGEARDKLLADCLDFYLAVKNDPNASSELTKVLKQRGLASNAGTSLILKIVRAVFLKRHEIKDKSPKVFAYQQAISKAAEAGITGAGFSDFLANNGGIDGLRRMTAKGETQKQVREKRISGASDRFQEANAPIGILPIPQLPDELKPGDGMGFAAAIVRKNANGTGTIVYGTGNEAVVNTILAIAGKELEQVQPAPAATPATPPQPAAVAAPTAPAAPTLPPLPSAP